MAGMVFIRRISTSPLQGVAVGEADSGGNQIRSRLRGLLHRISHGQPRSASQLGSWAVGQLGRMSAFRSLNAFRSIRLVVESPRVSRIFKDSDRGLFKCFPVQPVCSNCDQRKWRSCKILARRKNLDRLQFNQISSIKPANRQIRQTDL